MDIVLQLYGSLILTVLGFILPLLAILLSLFPEGIKVLTKKYENERKRSEENIINEIEKKKSTKTLDYEALERTLNTLKSNKRQAEVKLTYLKPDRFIINIFIPFILAFIGVIVAILNFSFIVTSVFLIVSIVSFSGGVYFLWASLFVLIEITGIVNESKEDSNDKIIELLSTLVERSGVDTLFLKKDKIKVYFNKKELKEDESSEFSVNRKHKIPISIWNSDDRMAKNVEVGFCFPNDFLIEKTSNLRILPDEKIQIVRFHNEIIHAKADFMKGDIEITFLKTGEYQIKTFIQGENIKYHDFKFKLKIVE